VQRCHDRRQHAISLRHQYDVTRADAKTCSAFCTRKARGERAARRLRGFILHGQKKTFGDPLVTGRTSMAAPATFASVMGFAGDQNRSRERE